VLLQDINHTFLDDHLNLSLIMLEGEDLTHNPVIIVIDLINMIAQEMMIEKIDELILIQEMEEDKIEGIMIEEIAIIETDQIEIDLTVVVKIEVMTAVETIDKITGLETMATVNHQDQIQFKEGVQLYQIWLLINRNLGNIPTIEHHMFLKVNKTIL
jgi:hypothetical protein